MRRWLQPLMMLGILLAAVALTSHYWNGPLYELLHVRGEHIQSLESLVNLLFLAGGAVLFLFGLRRAKRQDAVASPQVNVHVHTNELTTQKSEQARTRYLEKLRRYCQALPLAALGGEVGADEELTLDRVYIDLDTQTQIEKAQSPKTSSKTRGMPEEETIKRLSALDAFMQSTRLALLGDPGSGKSTFVKKIVAWQAAACLGESKPPPGCLHTWLPVFLTLRDLVPRLSRLNLSSLSEERQREALVATVRDHLLNDLVRRECEVFGENLREYLHNGQCFLVLDGLDEVPHEYRPSIRSAVAALLGAYRLQRIILTCRRRSYVGEAVLPGFDAHTLAPFNEEKIKNFSQAWYRAQKELGHVDALQAEAKAGNLAGAALAEDLRELSENPMMLTTMAIIHQGETELPQERVRLYGLAVDVLLRRWQKGKVGDGDFVISADLMKFLKDDRKLREAMDHLAYEAHRIGRKEKQVADLTRGGAIELLEAPEYLANPTLASEFLDYVDQRAGLLVGLGGEPPRKPVSYSFPHRSFQEYLAGCHIAGQREAGRQFFALTEEGDYWARAAQLGAEDLLFNGGGKGKHNALDLAYYLCLDSMPETIKIMRACLWSANIGALVGREEISRDTESPNGGISYLKRLEPRLLALLNSELTPPERAEAGVALARLGDPRDTVLRVEHMEFCFVPKGQFYMGSPPNDDMAYDDEKTDDLVRQMDHDLWISRFPITNGQFQAFVEAGGYEDPSFWIEAKIAKVWRNSTVQGRLDNVPRARPHDHGIPFNLQNHPVVGVT